MEHTSIWQSSVQIPGHSALAGDIYTEIAVIGGGLAGILTAHFLEQSGHKCIVLEADTIGSGQTGRTTAKITSQHGLIYQKLIQSIGKEQARLYGEANRNAIERYRLLIEKYKIDCEWAECPAYLYTTQAARLLRQEYKAAEELGIPAELTEETELPFPVEAALKFPGQARFHPLKFLAEISKSLTIYEHTRVLEAFPGKLVTNRGTVRAGKVIFACHYPFVNAPGYYFLRMHQERSYVVALKGAGQMEGMYLGIDPGGLSLRSAGEDVLLLGGSGHRTGDKPAEKAYETLVHQADRYWPGAKIVAQWSAQDCMTLDQIPYIGKFGKNTDGWYVASGFEKWGMTSSMTAALLLTDFICGRKNPYAEVFSPQRKTLMASARTFMEEGKYAAVNLLREKVMPPKEKLRQVRPGEGAIVEAEGEKVGVYKEENGQIYVVSVKCPHLGCQLAWNSEEKSWDCPCHGSRFDYQGRLLDGPAQTQAAICSVCDSKAADRKNNVQLH